MQMWAGKALRSDDFQGSTESADMHSLSPGWCGARFRFCESHCLAPSSSRGHVFALRTPSNTKGDV